MNEKLLHMLEFDKIIRKCAAFAATSLGKELVTALVPSPDLQEVKRRLTETDEASQVIRLKGGAPFGGIRDIRAAVKRAAKGGVISPHDLLDIANTAAAGRKLKRFLLSVHDDKPIRSIAALAAQLAELKPLEASIQSCIDDSGQILDSASAELAHIRSDIRAGEARVREKLEQMVRSHSLQKMLQEQLITIRNDRYVIPVKQEYRGQIGGIVHDQSASGATLFIEPEAVVALNNKLRELTLREQKEIEKILAALSAKVGEESDSLLANADLLARLDFIFAKAEYARAIQATLPVMNDRGFFKLKKSRHPLITGEVVPIDVELGNAAYSMIITGPNTGGKTVTLKTVGLLHVMAMAGMFIPAEDGSQLCVFDAIFADIGDEQSIEQNLSTFSSHLTNIISILREMTPKSLVLLDEVGAGTDPAEGSALAIAILEHIHATGCRLIATTHYSELKAYAYNRKGVVNASMEFDVQTLSPTYRLLIGIPGRSNAFAIAERLGLPKRIIASAQSQVGEEDQRVDSMIASLEANRLGAEAERQSAEQLRRELERMKQELAEERRKWEDEREKRLAKAIREADELVAKAKREAAAVIADLRRMALEEGASIKEHKLIEAKRKLEQAAPELPRKKPGKNGGKAIRVNPGDEVLVTHLGQKGHVVELAGPKEAVVQLGIMKMKVDIADLELVAEQAPQKQWERVAAGIKRTRDEHVRTELDLRGMSLADALSEVEKFLDEAFLANLHTISIIHGKGTGVLRGGIQEHLRRHKHVKSYRLGNYGEGGAGVTVVDLA
ncbi:MAG TPA: endonuclease MutS2 [Bacilli bacterium]